jgi:PAS domain S-box-containing protein
MTTAIRVLVVEDQPDDVKLLQHELRRAGFASATTVVETREDSIAHRDPSFDVILCDYNLPSFSGLEALRLVRERNLNVPFIIVSGTIGEDLAVAAMQEGAADYLLKDRLARLGRAIERLLQQRHLQDEQRRTEQKIAQLAAIVEFSEDAIISVDLDGVITSWNPAAERLYGWPRLETLGTHISGIIPPDRTDEWTLFLEQLRRGERIRNHETVRRRKDGSIIQVSLSISPIRDDAGGLIGASKSARDITERKQTEAALRQSEERYRVLADSLPGAVFTCTADGQCDYCNQWWCTYAGATPEQCQGTGWIAALHPDDRPRTLRRWNEALETGQLFQAEYRLRSADGSYRWFLGRAMPLREGQGAISKWYGTCTDIEDRKRAEAERNELLHRLQVQIERMPLAYLLFDADLRLTDWNPAAQRIFQYAKNEVLGMGPPFEKILPATAWPKAQELLRRIRSGDMAAHSPNENLTKDGRTISCDWFNTPLMTEDGRFGGLLCLAQDVTERKLLEERYRQAHKMEAIGQLAGGVAHDFNNLLTIINGYSELMLHALDAGDPKRELVAEILKAGERSVSLTHQLLAFSRKQVMAPKILDINDIVRDTEKMLRRLVGEDIQFATFLDADLGRVKADPGQMEQVLLNLAVNARDAMPQGGQLTIETHNVELDDAYIQTHPGARPGPHVLLTVSDSGVGMSDAVRQRIFEPFFTTKGSGEGTGLGLAVVHGIVTQSEGHIHVDSVVGTGTSFNIYLPRLAQAAEAWKAFYDTAPVPRGSETVLLVEDESAVRALARHVLQGLGYTVLEAGHGEEAERLCAHHRQPIHVLVTDVVMPGPSGRLVAERLHALRPELKVLYLSGYTDDRVVRHGVARDEVAFLQKPFSPAMLGRKLRDVLDGRSYADQIAGPPTGPGQ